MWLVKGVGGGGGVGVGCVLLWEMEGEIKRQG